MKKLMQILSVVVFLMVILSFPPVGVFSLQGAGVDTGMDSETRAGCQSSATN
jgi:hypothetical protein